MKTNREEQIELIWQKCIEANPERWNNPDNWEPNMYGDKFRLADVLLVIGVTKGFSAANIGGFTRDILNNGWNLRTDDLTQQSDECVAFLAELLKS